MKAKICGITNLDDALLAADAGAAFVGMVLAASPRRAAPAVCEQIAARLPAAVQPVLVFRDAPAEQIIALAGRMPRAAIQLHGAENAEFVATLRAALGSVRVIKAVEIGEDVALDEVCARMRELMQTGVTTFLLDSPKGAAGDPAAMDAIARRLARPAGPPWFWRAGGLTPDSVEDVTAGLYSAVDVARGVEAEAGRKDAAKVRLFIERAARLEGQQRPPDDGGNS
ncbi:N-(5'-phosphoribosyl)anthranilate isomerase [Phycisphaerae bacterium RAS1]|nr:N-(5'-phosphoribosyl)anthranilate isomerase [Phycisphaerae bacterium RAS1]